MRTGMPAFIIIAIAATFAFSAPAFGQDRDSDGTRMQARPVDVGTVHNDSLSPPSDRADWRMIRLDDQLDLSVELSVRSSGKSATLTVTSATGDELASARAGDDDAKISIELDAGIYYIAVESSDSLQYRLSIN